MREMQCGDDVHMTFALECKAYVVKKLSKGGCMKMQRGCNLQQMCGRYLCIASSGDGDGDEFTCQRETLSKQQKIRKRSEPERGED